MNSTVAVKQVTLSSSLVSASAITLYFPGGISFGRFTSLVRVVLPFSIGHLRSTFFTVSHRSAVCLIMVMRPYLTWRWILAPLVTFCERVPVAVMVSFLPLDLGQ